MVTKKTKKPTKKIVTKRPINQDRATVSLIFGIASILTFLFWFFGILFGVLAIAFAVAALMGKQDAGRAVAGVATGVSGMLLSFGMLIILTVTAPQVTESQIDTDRQSEMTSLDIQIEKLVSNGKTNVQASDLSIDGFNVIKSIGSDKVASKTNVLFVAGRFCDGSKGSHYYSLSVLMDDNTLYCTGYKQD